MKVVRKNVYYCEHCNKRSLSAGHLRKHEGSCTANKNRYCKLCERQSISDLIESFKSRFELMPVKVQDEYSDFSWDDFDVKWIAEPVTLQEVRDSVNNCPNCVFAIIRQCKFNFHYFKDAFQFDYKKELADRLAEINEAKMKEDMYSLF